MVATENPEQSVGAEGTLTPAAKNEAMEIVKQEGSQGKPKADIVKDNDQSAISDEASEDEIPKLECRTPVSKLPVARKTLMSLAKAQKNLQPYTREITIQSIVQRTLVKKAGLDDEGCKYILKRLITGVSTSVGFARPNYATMLMRITKAHAKDSGPEAVDEIISAVSAVYGDGGTFNANYVSGQLEKTLGMLASTSAVVRGARHSDISVDSARKIIRILRLCVTGAAHKWDLTPAVIDVMQELLDNLRKHDKIGDLMKVLWSWAEERSKMHDGVTMALLLFMEYEAISVEAFQKLYPKLSDIAEPLMAMFETGFPAEYGATPRDADDPEEERIMQLDEVPEITVDVRGLPIAWALILRYFSTAPAKAHFGGISTFWKNIVLPKLAIKIRSIEKRLIALLMLPSAVACLTEDEPIDDVLNGDTYTAVVNKSFRVKNSDPVLSKARNKLLLERFEAVKENLLERLYNVCNSSKLSASRRAILAEYMVRWTCECKRQHQETLIIGKLACVAELLEADKVPDFFANIAYFFLEPPKVIADVKALREGYIKVLARTVAACPRLLGAFVHIVLMAVLPHKYVGSKPDRVLHLAHREPCPPRPKAPSSFKSQMTTMEADLTSKSFSEALPTANPRLSIAMGAHCFTYLLDCLVAGQKADVVIMRLKFVERLLNGMVKKGEVNAPKPAQLLHSSLQLMSDKKLPPNVKDCLVTVARFVKISFFEPAAGNQKKLKALEKVPALIYKCVHCAAEEDGGTASALEKTVHMLCYICEGDANAGIVAKIGLELLAQSVDDSVTAVLFDMLHAAKSALSKSDDPVDVISESDEESVLEMSVDGDLPGSAVQHEANPPTNKVEESRKEESQEAGHADPEEKTDKSGKMELEDADNEQRDILDVDIDPDTEDPSVLEAFDKHLGQHMKLLTKKKAAAKLTKQGSEERVNKLLTLIGIAANQLRLRVERKNHECDQKTVAVFFDIFVRWQEFVLSDEYDASTCAKRVASLCEKYMSKKQLYVTKLTDVDLIADFAKRLFTCVIKYHGGRKQIVELSPTIARTATAILEMHAKHHSNGYTDLVDYYDKLWTMYLKGCSGHLSNNLFTAYADVASAEMIQLALRAEEVFAKKEVKIGERRRAIQGMHLLAAPAAELHSDKPLVAKPYWDRINSMGESLSDNQSEELWKDEVILKEFLGILRTGERVGAITKFYSQTIFQIAHSNKMYGQLRRDIRGMKRGLHASSEGHTDESGSARKNNFKKDVKKAKHE